MPGHVANRLQAALGREVYHLVAEGVVSAADVDTALCSGPGLRWSIMGNMMLNHLGGGPQQMKKQRHAKQSLRSQRMGILISIGNEARRC